MVDSILIRDKSKTKVIQGTPSSKPYKYKSSAAKRVERVEKKIAETKRKEKTKEVRKKIVQRGSRSSHRSSSSNKKVVQGTPAPVVSVKQKSVVPSSDTSLRSEEKTSRIKAPSQTLRPLITTTTNRVQQHKRIDNAPSVDLSTKDRKSVYAAQDTNNDFSVSSLSLSGRQVADVTRPRSDEGLQTMKDELGNTIRSNYYTTRLKQRSGLELGSVNPTDKEVVLKEDIDKNKFKLDMKRYDALTSALENKPDKDKLTGLYKLEQKRVNVNRALSGSMMAGAPSTKELSTDILRSQAEYDQSNIGYQGKKITSVTRPTTVLAYKIGGKDAPAASVLKSDASLRNVNTELSRRGETRKLDLKDLKLNLRPTSLAPSTKTNRDYVSSAKSSLVKGTALEAGEIAASMVVSAGAVKLAQTGSKAYKFVNLVDKVDQVQDAVQAGTGVYQIASGNVVGGAKNLLNLGITEGAAGHASKSVGGTLSLTPDSKVTLKDKLFPKGELIEFEGVDTTDLKYKTSPGIDRVNAQLRGRTVPDNTKLPTEIMLKSGEVQVGSDKFKRTTQYGKLQSVGGKEVRGNTFKDAWKGMWKSKKGSLMDVSQSSGGPDFTPSSRFDITPGVTTTTKSSFKPSVDESVTVRPNIDESLRISSKPSIRYSGTVDVSPDLTVKPDITSKLDLTFKPDVTVKPGVTVKPDVDLSLTPDESIRSDISPRSDITFKPDLGLTPSLNHGLTPALGALIGKPKRGRRYVFLPKRFSTYTVNNKILDISTSFKTKLQSYDRIKRPLGMKKVKKGRIYMPKKLKGFM